MTDYKIVFVCILILILMVLLLVFYKKGKGFLSSEVTHYILHQMEDLVIAYDLKFTIIYINESMEKFLNVNKKHLLGHNLLGKKEMLEFFEYKVYKAIITSEEDEKQVFELDKSMYYKRSSNSIFDERNNKIGTALFFNNITKEKICNDAQKYLVNHDIFTTLHNRNSFEMRLKTIGKDGQLPIGVVQLDIDNLKIINDTYGHDIGDMIIKNIADIIKLSFSHENDKIYRIGGDEFCVIIENCDEDMLVQDIDKAIQLCNNNEKIGEYSSGLSIGYSLMRDSTKGIMECIKEADMNMYENKKSK